MQTERVEPSHLLNQWDVNELRYSFVWEDFRNLLSAAKTLSQLPEQILSIGSSGDNSISLLLTAPNVHVTAIDLSPAQTSLIRNKIAAIRAFDHSKFIETVWGEAQILGRLDIYFKKFRQQALPLIWKTEDLMPMIHAENLEEQVFYWERADRAMLKRLAMEFFSQTALSSEGRDASQFVHVQKNDIGLIFLKSFERVIRTQLISENPYMFFFLTGRPLIGLYSHPLWNPESYCVIKERIGQIEVVTQDLESFLSARDEHMDRGYDLMNLSDIFEYLSPVQAESLFLRLGRSLSPEGILAYWTLLVDRIPQSSELRRDEDLSGTLSENDHTWFYSGFHVIHREGKMTNP